MANTQTSVKRALDDLEPKNLFAEAAKFKQESNSFGITTPPISAKLAQISTLTTERKAKIELHLARNYTTIADSIAESGKLPPKLKDDLSLSQEEEQAIVADVLNKVSAESMSRAQAVLAAAFQLHTKLEGAFYQDAINQSKQSFNVALVAAAIAVLAFLGAIVVLLVNGTASTNTAIITTIGGAIAALVAGVNFYLYGMTSTQFAAFQARLDRIQRFSLAEYMCELLGTEIATAETTKDKALVTVITNLASASLADSPTYITPLSPPSAPNAQNDQGGQSGNSQGGQSGNGQGRQNGTDGENRTKSRHS